MKQVRNDEGRTYWLVSDEQLRDICDSMFQSGFRCESLWRKHIDVATNKTIDDFTEKVPLVVDVIIKSGGECNENLPYWRT